MQWRAAERIGAEAECKDQTGGGASGIPAHIPRLKRARGTRSSCPIRMPDAAHRIPPPTMAGVTPANIPTHAAAACEAYGDEAYGDEGGVCDRVGTGDRGVSGNGIGVRNGDPLGRREGGKRCIFTVWMVGRRGFNWMSCRWQNRGIETRRPGSEPFPARQLMATDRYLALAIILALASMRSRGTDKTS